MLLISGAFFYGRYVYMGTNYGLLVSSGSGDNMTFATYSGIPADRAHGLVHRRKQNGAVPALCCITNAAGYASSAG